MATLIRSLHNSSATVAINLGIAGYDPTESLVIAPSSTVDLLSVMDGQSLHAMQAQLAALVAAGAATTVATIDSSLLYPAASSQVVARLSDVGVATDISTPVVLFTPTVSGLYQINAYQVCTASATGGDTSGQTLIGWTDVTGFNQWYFQATTLNNATLIVAGTKAVWAVAGSPIQFYTNGVSGPWVTLRENYYFTIVQL